MIFGYWFSQLNALAETDFSLQLRPNLWHLDALCVRDKEQFSTKGGAFALSGKGVEVHIFSTGIFEHDFIKTRVTHVYGTTDTVGRGTEIACIVGGHEVGIARECSLFSYSINDDDEFVEAVDAFFNNKSLNSFKPTLIIVDIAKAPTKENRQVEYVNNKVELAIKRLTDLKHIVLVPAGDGYLDHGQFLAPLNAYVVSPARLPLVTTVGAIEYDYTPAPFSNYGQAVNVLAPGCGIVTGNLNNKKSAVSGTRMAVACVAGIVVSFLQKNPKANKKDFDFFIANHFFTTGLTEYLKYYLLYDPVYNPDSLDTYAFFTYGTSYIFNYVFPLIDTYVLAHCPYLKSKIVIESLTLPDILANSQFNLQINAKSLTKYNEEKPLYFTLQENSHDWISFEIGETTGKIFGISKNIVVSTPCVFKVSVDDGLYKITETFVFWVQPNEKELKSLGSKLQTTLDHDVVLNLKNLKQNQILLNLEDAKKLKTSINLLLKRKVFLLQKTTGLFVAKTGTNISGEFVFNVPQGRYQALVIDEKFVYSVVLLNNMRT